MESTEKHDTRYNFNWQFSQQILLFRQLFQ